MRNSLSDTFPFQRKVFSDPRHYEWNSEVDVAPETILILFSFPSSGPYKKEETRKLGKVRKNVKYQFYYWHFNTNI